MTLTTLLRFTFGDWGQEVPASAGEQITEATGGTFGRIRSDIFTEKFLVRALLQVPVNFGWNLKCIVYNELAEQFAIKGLTLTTFKHINVLTGILTSEICMKLKLQTSICTNYEERKHLRGELTNLVGDYLLFESLDDEHIRLNIKKVQKEFNLTDDELMALTLIYN